MSTCPDLTTLSSYAEGQLKAEDAAVLEAHLLACGKCAQKAAALSVNERWIHRIQEMQRARESIAAALDRLSTAEQRVVTMALAQSRVGRHDRAEPPG
jgi:anti-sigma factor ChrR (cupin superfamily)